VSATNAPPRLRKGVSVALLDSGGYLKAAASAGARRKASGDKSPPIGSIGPRCLTLNRKGSIRTVNYALYCTAIAGFVLIAMDLPHPSNFADEGRRVLFTLAGVGIGVLVMLLAGLLQKRSSTAKAQAG
jgi:hypothetical protein